MSGTTKSRQKHKLEPISLEELAGTTGMSGFCSFLTRDNSVPVPVLDQLPAESGAPDSTSAAPPEPAGPATVPAPDYRLPRRIRIHPARTVEEGHSLGEQAVYETMYSLAKPAPQSETRILMIGLRTLAELSRMAYSNCKANVRTLVAKLAIDESPEFSYTDGRTYTIYPPSEILRRRQAAGMTHVVRNRGVMFVDPASGQPLAGTGEPG